MEDDLEGEDLDFESEAAKRKRATKVERQWTKWSQETIPALFATIYDFDGRNTVFAGY